MVTGVVLLLVWALYDIAYGYAGVVETGLFINMVTCVYFGNADGTVKLVDK